MNESEDEGRNWITIETHSAFCVAKMGIYDDLTVLEDQEME